MRFLTVVTDLDYRGTQRAAQNYSLALAARGHAVAVLALAGGGVRQRELADRGIAVWVGGEELDQALEQSRHFGADVIHIHRAGMHQPQWGPVLRRLKVGHTRVMETSVFGRVDYSDDAALIDVHLQISRWCLYRWRKWLGGRHQVGVHVPYAVDLTAFPEMSAAARAAARQGLNLPSRSFVCGRIGKWHGSIFAAFARLLCQCPDAVLLNVSDHPDVHAFAASLPAAVRQRIVPVERLLGDAALARFYAGLDCLLQVSSNGETFGMILAEAMACGTPVVTASTPTRDNAQVEVVRHGEGGLVAGSPARLPMALTAFQADDGLRRRCAARARRLIADRYTLADVAARLEAVAGHAVASDGRPDLEDRLRHDDSVVTRVEDDEIGDGLRNTVGGPSAADLAVMRVVHNPVFYRIYSRLQHGF